MVGQMDSKNSRGIFVTKISSCCNVIRNNTKLEGHVTGIGQSSPASFWGVSFPGHILYVATKIVDLKKLSIQAVLMANIDNASSIYERFFWCLPPTPAIREYCN